MYGMDPYLPGYQSPFAFFAKKRGPPPKGVVIFKESSERMDNIPKSFSFFGLIYEY